MSNKNNRICKVCGEKYYFCPSCSKIPVTEKYKNMFCSKNCYDIFYTLSRLTVGTINKPEAKDILSSLDLSKQNQFSEKIKSEVDEIMKTNKKPKKKAKLEPVYNNEAIDVDDKNSEVTLEVVEDKIIADGQELVENPVETEF